MSFPHISLRLSFAHVARTTASLGVIAAPAMAGTEASASNIPEAPATARFVTDADVIAPGAPFFVGVELAPHPGWHVYWKHPGDAGLSTELTFDLPEGFEVGEVQYPVPEAFVQPGDITGYGYSRPVVLFAEVTGPSSLSPGDEVSIGVTADWLSCAHVCIPGRAALERTLRVEATAVRSLKREAWTDALPAGMEGYRPFVDSVSATKTGATSASYELNLRWLAIAPATIDWIPNTPEAVSISNTTMRRLGQTTKIAFEASLLDDASLHSETMETVVAYDGPDGERLGVLLPVSLGLLGSPPN